MPTRRLGRIVLVQNEDEEWIVECWDYDGLRWPEMDFCSENREEAQRAAMIAVELMRLG